MVSFCDTYCNYEASMLIANTQTLNNFGNQRMMNFNTIVCYRDPSTVRTFKQMFNSEADIDGAQSGLMNVYKDDRRVVVLPYLATTAAGAYDSTKRRWWFNMAIGMNGWQGYYGDWIAPTLKTPEPGNNGEDIHTLNCRTWCPFATPTATP